ncbi:galactose-1-phosphate uridylyltransferase [Streptomyces sp. DSM 44917]|uniref:Galactose-1-phosphate uridylyltransferase n=1 Tax=Streptomyces boetiae TaxID=3075541 RepID=A0ABU2L9Q5_9ACTN|nr:galactose-1-phosphate uridylyltransferase [Streptomyces sp. DSM 44917]MDT0308008.1 galactose-1-phosphate uridylyltransferase [Streptomyces sp. DSM 44917]
MERWSTRLADGRELIYYAAAGGARRAAEAADGRRLGGAAVVSEVRFDPLRGEPVAYAAHRQGRTYLPPDGECPLCPSRGGRRTEIPAADYEVAVLENRFPAFAGGDGRCEVVCFSAEHGVSFAELTPERVALVLWAWTDRTAALGRLPGVRQVYCFENSGTEIGVTLAHPHGQVYGYPYVTPHTARALRAVAEHRERTGANLYDEILAAERADGRRVVRESARWIAFVPRAARWPYEVHLYPRRRVPDLMSLDEEERAEFPEVYLDLLRRFAGLFGPAHRDTPYIAGWHQVPAGLVAREREDFALHLELFTIRRGPGRLKHLAGSESGMGAFLNDVLPESAAHQLRKAAP